MIREGRKSVRYDMNGGVIGEDNQMEFHVRTSDEERIVLWMIFTLLPIIVISFIAFLLYCLICRKNIRITNDNINQINSASTTNTAKNYSLGLPFKDEEKNCKKYEEQIELA